jgi:hypothetical protein
MTNIIKGKLYTPDEIQSMYGQGWLTNVYEQNTFNPPLKPSVHNFSEFNDYIKNIYNQIYSAVKSVNGDENFEVYATGDYISGKWISHDEATQYSEQYKKYIQPSPFDYWTTAKKYPSRFVLDNIDSNIKIRLNPSTSTHTVTIPPQ